MNAQARLQVASQLPTRVRAEPVCDNTAMISSPEATTAVPVPLVLCTTVSAEIVPDNVIDAERPVAR